MGSFIEDFSDMIKELLTKELDEYSNLGLTSNSLERLRMGVIAFFVAIIVAAFIVAFNRNVYSGFILRINSEQAWSEDKAKTLVEYGYEKNTAIRSALKHGRKYRGLVRCVEKDEFDALEQKKKEEIWDTLSESEKKNYKPAEFVFDLSKNHFYIPEEKNYQAERRFLKKGTGIVTLLIITVLSLIALFVALFFLPDILQYINNFVGILKE